MSAVTQKLISTLFFNTMICNRVEKIMESISGYQQCLCDYMSLNIKSIAAKPRS